MKEKLKKIKFSTTQMIVFGFLAAILIGTALLMLPFATKPGETTTLIDAMFTATTSICVTGLVTVNTLSHWTTFGHVVILILIQFGGLGVVTFTTTILLMMRKRITLRERLLIQEAYNLDTLRGLVRLTIKIMKGTFVVEGIGALLYSI
ncbi:MAG TPA: potassium transporter KtrB, partial [Lachnospiraceae bacterium]|nr:potassium transporter KtrB [Lachnospiraceae bacterium]